MEEIITNLYKGIGQAKGVPELRDKYEADLVQVVGVFPANCGIG